MNPFITDDVRITDIRPLISPAILMQDFPASAEASKMVYDTREAVRRILKKEDDRLAVMVGPCSIHDTVAAIDYAGRLASIREKYEKELLLIMRVYFEKPRTTVGWKGLINDPFMDESYNINSGLRIARGLLLRLSEMGVPAATEFLDVITPQYISDLIVWGAIGARTTESQVHRELASGLSMPIGFKNGTTGCVQIAVDGIVSSAHPHCFLSVTKQGVSAIVSTSGNDSCHVILRGSTQGTNYSSEHVKQVWEVQQKANISNRIMIDCSHGNSHKKWQEQANVAANIAAQLAAGEDNIGAVMIESNINSGNQKCVQPLQYGVSITDACVDWDGTLSILDTLAEGVRARRAAKA
ncbi:MAG: 3-deoxy-7-phosphoheptulonate synthase [Akkermansia sp.]|nr:3-deoxy-7-phosphoheptulonate synthase [Akkermansia sp.]MBR1978497.1 3-deoxy-7-phosphoheptulonate synthase [Akkermansia sp.]